jgi:uncharacterized protein (TIGR02284 family)
VNSQQETRERGVKCDYLFMKKQNEVIDNLIETLKDGQEGFKQAAESVRNPALKTLFSDYSQQRSRFATALQSEARSHGETKPENSSSTAGALHRGWINLKSAITGGDEHAILAECERGEDSAVEEYKKALDDGLTPSAQDLVSRQFTEVKAAHDRIRSLRDASEG